MKAGWGNLSGFFVAAMLTPLRKGMSDAFWESFEAGCENGREVMGQTVMINGVEMQGTPRPAVVRDGIVAGGTSAGVTHEIEVGYEQGKDVPDGAVVECRMLKGKVIYKENFGGGWVIFAGPENRWEEEDF